MDTPPAAPLEKTDLIEDRSVASRDQDRLGHLPIAEELARLVLTVDGGTNIAVFAPWGTGKSGLSNLLHSRLTGATDAEGLPVKYARFDAFKFGENPLRKQFISQVSQELLKENPDDKPVKVAAFTSDLYRSTQKNEFVFADAVRQWDFRGSVKSLLERLRKSIAVPVFVIAAMLAYFLIDNAKLANSLVAAIVAVLTAGGIISFFAKFVVDGLTVKSTTDAPSTDEQFEEKFCELLDYPGVAGHRAVIFIDELDRCSADEVVTTLETLKTFLNVDRCVCVVAADHQVLEQALRRKARQETPRDTANPYFSSGSSYLDKIFQFQISLPPVRKRDLTRFALDLTSNASGIWSSLPNRASTVSVLIPNHVQNPRRAKVLLNSYAIAFRMASVSEVPVLDADQRVDRTDEMAKIVCLQCEFPLFVQALQKFPYLDQLIPAASDALEAVADRVQTEAEEGRAISERDQGAQYFENKPGFASIDAWSEARRYAEGEAAVAIDLVAGTPESEGTDDEERVSSASLRKARADQLIEYLRRTIDTPINGDDLIYLGKSANTYGLTPGEIDAIETAAENGNGARIAELTKDFDDARRRGAIQFVASLGRERDLGLLGNNATAALLDFIGRGETLDTELANEVAGLVAGQERALKLRGAAVSGAVALAKMTDHHTAQALLNSALEAADGGSYVTGLAKELLECQDKVSGDRRDAIARAFVLGVDTDYDETLDAWAGIGEDAAIDILRRAGAELSEVPDGMEDGSEPPEGDEEGAISWDAMVAERAKLVIGKASTVSPGFLQSVCATACDLRGFESEVRGQLTKLDSITNPKLALFAVYDATGNCPIGEWAEQLKRIDAKALSDAEGHAEHLGDMLDDLVISFNQDEIECEDARPALEQIQRLGKDASVETQRAANRIAEILGVAVTNATLRKRAERVYDLAQLFKSFELGDLSAFAVAMINGLTATINAGAWEPDFPQEELLDFVLAKLHEVARDCPSDVLDQLEAAANNSPSLTESTKANIRLAIDSARVETIDGYEERYSASDVESMIRSLGQSELGAGVAVWLRSAPRTPADVNCVLDAYVPNSAPHEVCSAISDATQSWNSPERMLTIEPVLERIDSQSPDLGVLRAVWEKTSNQNSIAKLLSASVSANPRIEVCARAFSVWKELAPTGNATRDSLVRDVFLPTTRIGVEGQELAFSNLGLVPRSSPAAIKAEIKLLVAQIEDDQIRKNAENTMDEFGWSGAIDQLVRGAGRMTRIRRNDR